MKRINVIGITGSGKSTIAKMLALKLGYKYIQLDELFWNANWVASCDAEFFPRIRDALSGDTWVLDGNYNRTNHIKWERVDTIIWIDYSWIRTLLQLLIRSVSRAWTQKELWPNTGNRESFRKTFLSRDSILLWFFKGYRRNKINYATLIASPSHSHITFVRLRHPNETRLFLDTAGIKPEFDVNPVE